MSSSGSGGAGGPGPGRFNRRRISGGGLSSGGYQQTSSERNERTSGGRLIPASRSERGERSTVRSNSSGAVDMQDSLHNMELRLQRMDSREPSSIINSNNNNNNNTATSTTSRSSTASTSSAASSRRQSSALLGSSSSSLATFKQHRQSHSRDHHHRDSPASPHMRRSKGSTGALPGLSNTPTSTREKRGRRTPASTSSTGSTGSAGRRRASVAIQGIRSIGNSFSVLDTDDADLQSAASGGSGSKSNFDWNSSLASFSTSPASSRARATRNIPRRTASMDNDANLKKQRAAASGKPPAGPAAGGIAALAAGGSSISNLGASISKLGASSSKLAATAGAAAAAATPGSSSSRRASVSALLHSRPMPPLPVVDDDVDDDDVEANKKPAAKPTTSTAAQPSPGVRASMNPGAISNFHANLMRPSQFSANSSMVARQFLMEDASELTTAQPADQLPEEAPAAAATAASSSATSSDNTLQRTNTNQSIGDSSYINDLSESLSVFRHNRSGTAGGGSGHMSSGNDLEWNPEAQRAQQDEWRRQNLMTRTTSYRQREAQAKNPHSMLAPMVQQQGGQGHMFPQRPDLRSVDQTVNLMDQSLGDLDVGALGAAGGSDTGGSSTGKPKPRDSVSTSKSKKSKKKSKRHRSRGESFDHEASSSTILSQVSLWLDERSTDSAAQKRLRRAARKYKYGSNSYDERSCWQDLFCSYFTVLLMVAAALGALIAWKTGAFFPPDEAATTVQETLAPTPVPQAPAAQEEEQQAQAVPVEQDTAAASGFMAALAMAQDQAQPTDKDGEPIVPVVVELLNSNDLDLMEIITQGGISTSEELNTEGSPQHLAFHWVTGLEDPSMLATVPPQKKHHLNQVMLEGYALAVLYYGGNGYKTYTLEDEKPHWENHIWKKTTNWLRPVPLCQWYGVDCEETDEIDGEVEQHIVHLDMKRNNIKGPLPRELSVLSDLRNMDFANNGLRGTIPEEVMGRMKQLEYLTLQQNDLTGSLPTCIGNLTSIRGLQLFDNQLDGSLPSEMNACTNLQVLSLHKNKFTGSIPYLADLRGLEYLLLQENHLSEKVPFEIFGLVQMVEFNIGRNDLTGTIPAEIESCPKMRKFSVDNNKLSSHLPDIFNFLPELEEVRVHSNKLEGPIPTTLGSLTKLEKLLIDTNEFTGPIPTELAELTKLVEFRAYFNELEGRLPRAICDLKDTSDLVFIGLDCLKVTHCDCCDKCL